MPKSLTLLKIHTWTQDSEEFQEAIRLDVDQDGLLEQDDLGFLYGESARGEFKNVVAALRDDDEHSLTTVINRLDDDLKTSAKNSISSSLSTRFGSNLPDGFSINGDELQIESSYRSTGELTEIWVESISPFIESEFGPYKNSSHFGEKILKDILSNALFSYSSQSQSLDQILESLFHYATDQYTADNTVSRWRFPKTDKSVIRTTFEKYSEIVNHEITASDTLLSVEDRFNVNIKADFEVNDDQVAILEQILQEVADKTPTVLAELEILHLSSQGNNKRMGGRTLEKSIQLIAPFGNPTNFNYTRTPFYSPKVKEAFADSNDYTYLRYVLLHELGHIAGKKIRRQPGFAKAYSPEHLQGQMHRQDEMNEKAAEDFRAYLMSNGQNVAEIPSLTSRRSDRLSLLKSVFGSLSK